MVSTMDWQPVEDGYCVGEEKLRVVGDVLEVYRDRWGHPTKRAGEQVLARYGLVPVDPNRVVGEKLWIQMGGMVNAPAIRVEIGIDGVLRMAKE